MILDTVYGDLIALFKERKFSAIAHGCNCFHVMGAGIAGQIAEQFPEAYRADEVTSRGYSMKLGSYTDVMTEYGRIINLYTQYRPGVEIPLRLYDSIKRGFERLDQEFGGDERFVLGIPKIGAGIAGGNWGYISYLIDAVTPNLNITLVEYQP